ncbi:hypothetical protein [Sphingobacterium endophyticum]|uniref:hypothetical protein n=1 Tax=Sphingobacterium endophyticum TaxID=2546448 RepID=UPI0012E1812B|nr:hypothetical protein [Sphingobacterium endophyticum]
MWYIIFSYLLNSGNPTLPIEPTNPDIVIVQSVDDGEIGDNGHVRPPRPKK